MKVCVVTPRYAISGVPLAQWRLARALKRAGHHVDLLIGYSAPVLQVPAIDGVTITVLGQAKTRDMLWPLIRYLRRAKPHVIFSAEDHLNALVALAAVLARSSARIAASSRVTPYDTYSGRPLSKRWWLKQIVPPLMRRVTAVTAVSAGIVEEYRQIFPRSRHQVAYNFFDEELVAAAGTAAIDEPWLTDSGAPVFVAAGNLAEWKGFDRLIAAMARFTRDRAARLLILGEGPLHAALSRQISDAGLRGTIRLVGRVANPYPYYKRADAFLHMARVESFGNVLVEAMACGATVVSVDCPVGPREVLDSGRYGYLVPQYDEAAFVAAMGRALDAPIPPERLLEGVARFKEATVIARNFELLGLAA